MWYDRRGTGQILKIGQCRLEEGSGRLLCRIVTDVHNSGHGFDACFVVSCLYLLASTHDKCQSQQITDYGFQNIVKKTSVKIKKMNHCRGVREFN